MGMSDATSIVRTKFINMADEKESYGYRMYNGNLNTYCNCLEKSDLPEDDLELLAKVKNDPIDDTCESMLEVVESMEEAIWIGNNMYSWDEVKHIFGE
jgi:hypothetical protein